MSSGNLTPLVLLVSNRFDFATDYVVAELRQRRTNYVRLNLDDLKNHSVSLDPVNQRLSIGRIGAPRRAIGPVSAVFFRAPTHLRESSGHRYTPEDLLSRHQWAAFGRSLTIFRDAFWINHPRETYLAENKPYQLALATACGLRVPRTLISNAPPPMSFPSYGASKIFALKGLDSFLLRIGGKDAFSYTTPVNLTEASVTNMKNFPAIIQQWLQPKLDIRVTVVGSKCFPVQIKTSGGQICGDWRLLKNEAVYESVALPREVERACIKLVNRLGLVFGAIDLALSHGKYYFLEINPTGEWVWLVDQLRLPIHTTIADALLSRGA